ncbi:MAG: hypothetical protein MK212_02285 [Saprospiraceae bacterium]|nr:hypothetical protein [Saprospiraceae bacterium]
MKELQLQAGKVSKLGEQIYCFCTLPQDNFDAVVEDMEKFVEFIDRQTIYLITDLRKVKKAIPKKTRDYIINSLSSYILGSAILVQSNLSKIIVNLALSFKQSAYPRKLFSDDQAALEWLKMLQQKNK